MGKLQKRTITIATILCIIIMLMPVGAFAADAYPDVSKHWAKEKIESWADQGYVSGYADGNFKPDQYITRAEFMTLVNKAFNFTDIASINYTDVNPVAWYANTVSRAKAAGYISGYPDGTMKPDNPISREEAASIILRLKNLDPNEEAVNKFTDAGNITWSKGAVGALANTGIMQGYPDGTFLPQKYITRAEAVAALSKALGNNEPGKTVPVVVTIPSITPGTSTGGGGGGGSSISTVSVNTISNMAVVEGVTTTTTLTTSPSDSVVNAVSSDTDIATVNASDHDLVITGVSAGTSTITVTASKTGYKKGTKNFVITVLAREVSSIDIKTQPAILSYVEGQDLKLAGLEVTLTYNDESTENVDVADFAAKGITVNWADGTALTVAEHNSNPVVLTCNGQTADTSSLTVVPREVSSIAVKIQPSTLSYVDGQNLNLAGLEATLTYNDASTEDVVLLDFASKGITVNWADGTALTVNDHNGNPVVLTCNGQTANTSNLTVVPREVSSIAVKIQPSTLSYVEGQNLNLAGLEVTLTYNDESTENVLPADFTAKGITVNWADGTALTVNDHNGNPVVLICNGQTANTSNLTVVPREVSSIAIKIQPSTLSYVEGQNLNLAGLEVTLTYNDESTENALPADFTAKGITVNWADGTALTVNDHNGNPVVLTCNGQSANTSNLTVVPREVSSIAVKTQPDTLIYYDGQSLDMTGLEVTLTYNDASTEDVALTEFAAYGITLSPVEGTVLAITDTEVAITVNGKTAKQAITVNAIILTADTSSNDVDNEIDITFATGANFTNAITGVSFNGTPLTVTTDYVVSSGKVTLKPAGGNSALRTPATANVVISATGYADSTVSQTITAGLAKSITVTTQAVPGANGQFFATQPVITIYDRYDNICSDGASSSASVYANSLNGVPGQWSMYGTMRQYAAAGVATFNDLQCWVSTPGTGSIRFELEGPGFIAYSSFTLPDIEITSFDAIAIVDVGAAGYADYANAAEVQAVLPANVKANSNKVTVPVTSWADTDNYNPTLAENYTFTAVLGTIPSGYANSGSYTATVEVVVAIAADLTDYNLALNAVIESDYTSASWAIYQAIIDANVMTALNTQSEVDTATDNILTAQASLVEMSVMGGTVSITGVAKFGQTLEADITGITYIPGTAADIPKYQWQRDGEDISAATASTYTLTADDIGKVITVTVSADGNNAVGSVTSAGTSVIAKADGPTAPLAPTEAGKTATSITLAANLLHEFSIDGGAWQDSNIFTELISETAYDFTARIKATTTHEASDASDPVTIMTGSALVTGITVTGTADITKVVTGGTLQMIAAVEPVDATDGSVTWSVVPGSGNAMIDLATGLLTGIQEGTVTVKATANDASAKEGTLNITIATNYSIGNPGQSGGLVFYDKGNYSEGWQYLEAATLAQDEVNEDWWWLDTAWSNIDSSLAGTSTAAGTGQANTTAILGQPGHYQSAAEMCDSFNYFNIDDFTNYNDWFLPSRDELTLIYQNLYMGSHNAEFEPDAFYWSSSELSAADAYGLTFSNQWNYYYKSYSSGYVRPVRVF